jgi:hypothetical protein
VQSIPQVMNRNYSRRELFIQEHHNKPVVEFTTISASQVLCQWTRCPALHTQKLPSNILLQVRLNEALGLAGAVSDSDLPSAPDAKRLSCHVAVLRSILASGALGALQHVMEVIITELLRSAYR